MNPDFSERQFETAVNIELTVALRPYMEPAVPVVPSTNQEAETGWDALYRLGTGYFYFLQYKTAVWASRRTGWNEVLWDAHRCPYFRFDLHADSNGECRQHRLLGELRSRQPGVYYCAPAFVKEEELWERVGRGTVLEGSRLIDLADVPLRDTYGHHKISFDDSGLVQAWSEPQERSMGERGSLIRRQDENRREISKEEVSALLVDAVSIAGRSRRARREAEPLDAWLGSRVPPEAREYLSAATEMAEPREVVPMLARSLRGGELMGAISRVLRLDFGLTWVVEPLQAPPVGAASSER